MATFKQDIPHRVTVYHDNHEQERELKEAMLQKNHVTLMDHQPTKRKASLILKKKFVR